MENVYLFLAADPELDNLSPRLNATLFPVMIAIGFDVLKCGRLYSLTSGRLRSRNRCLP